MITTISHEFRTPLTVINNSTSLLDKYYDRLSDSKREEQYLRIRQSIFYLTDLLQGVSLVESTQNRAVRPRQEMIQFGQLCQQLTTELKQETAAPPNLKIDVTGNETTPLILDYYLLKQVILNLLTNALKYSPSHQPVHLHIVLTTNLILTVTDRGVGIPESEKEKVWELFYRGSNVDVHSGLGLGLYVVKQLLESMAGTITLTDNPAGGTIFTVKLPIKQVTDSSA
jgi:signal transduction histidine kinase